MRARETWAPTKPTAPVTRTERPDLEAGRAEAHARFSQFGPRLGPTTAAVWRLRRLPPLTEAFEAVLVADGGDKKRNSRIRKRKINDQRVRLGRSAE